MELKCSGVRSCVRKQSANACDQSAVQQLHTNEAGSVATDMIVAALMLTHLLLRKSEVVRGEIQTKKPANPHRFPALPTVVGQRFPALPTVVGLLCLANALVTCLNLPSYVTQPQPQPNPTQPQPNPNSTNPQPALLFIRHG
jgi:hypothetical protein